MRTKSSKGAPCPPLGVDGAQLKAGALDRSDTARALMAGSLPPGKDTGLDPGKQRACCNDCDDQTSTDAETSWPQPAASLDVRSPSPEAEPGLEWSPIRPDAQGPRSARIRSPGWESLAPDPRTQPFPMYQPFPTPSDGAGIQTGKPDLFGSDRSDSCDKESRFIVRGRALGNLSVLDSVVQRYMKANDIPNGAMSVVASDGRLVMARGYTNPRAYENNESLECTEPDSIFRIGSVSKSFTAAAIMRLVEMTQSLRGPRRLNLEDRVYEHVDLNARPGELFRDTRLLDLTVDQLLTHLGGWASTFNPTNHDEAIAEKFGVTLPISIDQIIEFMAEEPLLNPPGTVRTYSNYGYVLLGKIIENVSEMSYESYLRLNIWNPLGFQSTGCAQTRFRFRADREVKYFWHASMGLPAELASVCSAVEDDEDEGRRGPYYCAAVGSTLWGTNVLGGRWRMLGPYGRRNIENGQGAGTLRSSVVDLARWAWQFTAVGRTASPILSAGSIGTMTSELYPTLGTPPWGYGYGWSVGLQNSGIERTGAITHGGSMEGTAASVYIFPPGNIDSALLDNVCISILFNRNISGEWSANKAAETAFFVSLFDISTTELLGVTNWGTGDLFTEYGL